MFKFIFRIVVNQLVLAAKGLFFASLSRRMLAVTFRKGALLPDYGLKNKSSAEDAFTVDKPRVQSKKMLWLFVLALLLFLVFMFSLVEGSYGLSVKDTFLIISYKLGFYDTPPLRMHEIIIWNLRLPRILTAVFAGAILSVSGAIYQGCFRNPLVEPYILGVSSGAAFGAALAIVLPSFSFFHVNVSLQLSSFVFAMSAVGLAWFVAGRGSTMSIILSGIVIGSVFTAGVAILKYVSTDSQLREITFWLMGGFYNAGWGDVKINSVVFIFCFIVSLFFAWKLNVLSLGDVEAKSLGVDPVIYRLFFIVIATLMTSSCVSSVGVLSWVGLMMPHAARMIFGFDNRTVIIAGALLGGIYLVACDTITRVLLSAEVPVGIVTSLLGAPYIIYLLRRKGREVLVG